jgi:hypothetical protein
MLQAASGAPPDPAAALPRRTGVVEAMVSPRASAMKRRGSEGAAEGQLCMEF